MAQEQVKTIWLVVGGILLWAFVLRPKVVGGKGVPSSVPSPEFQDLRVTTIPGRKASPERVVYVGDTVGISGGTVQYKGPAANWMCRVYLRDSASNDVAVYISNFATPLSLTWTSVSIPQTAGTLPSTAPLGDLYGVAQVAEAVSPYTVKVETAPVLVYKHQVPSSGYSGLAVSWI